MTKSPRKFVRQVYSIEVLSEEPLPDPIGLEALVFEITEGNSSGVIELLSTEIVSGAEMVNLLLAQGSDPEFLGLDASGNDVEDI